MSEEWSPVLFESVLPSCPHAGAAGGVCVLLLLLPGQTETGGAPEQEHEDPDDGRTDPGWAVPLHRPGLQCHPRLGSRVPQIHRLTAPSHLHINTLTPSLSQCDMSHHNIQINLL